MESSCFTSQAGPARYNTLRESPAGATYKLCVVQFKVPGAQNGGSDKGPDGNRVDSIPIANSAGSWRRLWIQRPVLPSSRCTPRTQHGSSVSWGWQPSRPCVCAMLEIETRIRAR